MLTINYKKTIQFFNGRQSGVVQKKTKYFFGNMKKEKKIIAEANPLKQILPAINNADTTHYTH